MNQEQFRYFYTAFFASILFILNSGASAQVIMTVAGNGTAGFSGDGGPAISAQLNFPIYTAFQAPDKLYVSEAYNYRIRKVNLSTGIISTVAGNGTAGYSGDGVAATLASLNLPSATAIDGAGNLFIADNANHRIRKVDAAGIITTVAGVGTMGYSGDGGAATSAVLHNPDGVAVDGAGNLYIADQMNNRIRKVNSSGIITTIAGTGASGYSGDGGPATAARLNAPRGLTMDVAGNLYIADVANNCIRKINTGGLITTIAGTGTPGFTGDGMPATATELDYPRSVVLDGAGDIYIADELNYRVRKINSSGIISTIAGSGVMGYNGDSCAATATELNAPWGVTLDGSGHVYIAESVNSRIRMIGPGHAPVFTHGNSRTWNVCENVMSVPDSILSVSDSDAHQTEIWSLFSPPLHGTAIAADTATATGGVIVPAGLSYTPVTGYTGNDTFKVMVLDCGGATDTITVYVFVGNCALQAYTGPNQIEESIHIYPNPANNELTITTDIGAYSSFAIWNTTGQLMMQQNAYTGRINADIHTWATGLYYVSMRGGRGSVVKKFVKL